MKQQWISLHLFYHDNPLPLLVECVQPMVKELSAQNILQRFFFIRYWQGGPHIRLRLLPSSEAARETLLERVTARVEAFFTVHPAQKQVQEEAYSLQRTRFGLAEYGQADQTPLYPNNSLRAIPYEPEYERYGGTSAMPLVEQHFMESSQIALMLLQEQPSRDQLSGQSLAMLFMGNWLCKDDFNALPGIFEEYYNWWSPGSRLGSHFAQLHLRQHERMRDLIHRLQALKPDRAASFEPTRFLSEDSSGDTSVAISHWISSIYTLKEHLLCLSRNNDLHADILRVIFSCIHMHNNRLGISTVEEAYLSFLLKETLAVMISQSAFSPERAFHK